MTERLSQIAGHLFSGPGGRKGLLEGQVAIVTGAAQGIGAEVARLFAAEGARVVASDMDAAKTQAVVEQIEAAGGQAIAVVGDLLQQDYIDRLVREAAAFGNGKIHIIVNNAGYTWDGMSDKQWDTILELHAKAPFRLIRTAAPYFRLADGEPRNIVNISSTAGVNGNPGQANYSLAKAGVTGLSKTLAKEWGPRFGVRCNTVAFGRIQTRLTQAKEKGAFVLGPDGQRIALGIPKAPEAAEAAANAEIPLRRPGTPTEAASAILAVASPLFSYVTGQTIMVTGGRHM